MACLACHAVVDPILNGHERRMQGFGPEERGGPRRLVHPFAQGPVDIARVNLPRDGPDRLVHLRQEVADEVPDPVLTQCNGEAFDMAVIQHRPGWRGRLGRDAGFRFRALA